MSMYYRKHGKFYEPEYERPGRTKQGFKDDCDINKILEKAQRAGSLSHLQRYGAEYGDFSDAPESLLEAEEMLNRGRVIFNDLPAELRREFKHDPHAFFSFVNDPANSGRLHEIFPELAKPTKYFPDVSPSTPPDGLLGEASAPEGASTTTPPPQEGGSE